MRLTLIAAFAVSVLPGLTIAHAPPHPARIILIRHAEKPDDENDPHLSPEGVKRAKRLVAFITADPSMTRYGTPVALFATQTTKHDDGQRTQETLAPLAKALGLRVQAPFLGKDYAGLAQLLRTEHAYDGKTIVICWNHEWIPELVAALGVSPQPPKWKSKVFDDVYVISYTNGKAELTVSKYDGR